MAKTQLHSSIFPGMVADKDHGGILTWADPHSNGSCAGFPPASPFALLSVETFRTAILDGIFILYSISCFSLFVNLNAEKSAFCIKLFCPCFTRDGKSFLMPSKDFLFKGWKALRCLYSFAVLTNR